MTDHPIKREFDEAYGLVEGKAHDYAEDDNVFSNFEFAAAAAGISVEQVFLTLIGVKVARLGQLVGNDKVPNNESIDDTVLDGMNYFGLMKAYMRQERPDTLRDIFDEFARFELGDETVDDILEGDVGRGLLDAVLNDPVSAPWDGFDACTDPNCCGLEDEFEGSDGGFLEAQVEDGLDYVWQEGDMFMLNDQRIYTGYGVDKQVMEVLESSGPYEVTYVAPGRVSFYDDNARNLTAKYSEIERI
jgi:hypothetical protein